MTSVGLKHSRLSRIDHVGNLDYIIFDHGERLLIQAGVGACLSTIPATKVPVDSGQDFYKISLLSQVASSGLRTQLLRLSILGRR
jgi:hypothetical protein